MEGAGNVQTPGAMIEDNRASLDHCWKGRILVQELTSVSCWLVLIDREETVGFREETDTRREERKPLCLEARRPIRDEASISVHSSQGEGGRCSGCRVSLGG